MAGHTYRNRRASVIENRDLRITVLEGGGHIAEIFDKKTGVNPLWTPVWPSIEPADYSPSRHPEFGVGPEARLLAGIMGHNVCLDIFGGPSPEEEAAGLTVHGEAPVVPYAIESDGLAMVVRADLPVAQLRIERRLELKDRAVRICESVENLARQDRPVAWTQHVTLGPPFLEPGVTEFRASATRSQVLEGPFGEDDYLQAGTVFDWPLAPRRRPAGPDAWTDLRIFNKAPASSAYTAHLMDPQRAHACFVAFSPRTRLAFGYVWKQAEFPWLGIWEENRSRRQPPWAGRSMTCGMEFGVSPFAESRRRMIDRGRLFDVPTYRWIPAKTRVEVEYWALASDADQIPESLEWPADQ